MQPKALLVPLSLCFFALPSLADDGAQNAPAAALSTQAAAPDTPATTDATANSSVDYQFVSHQSDGPSGPETTVEFQQGKSETTVVEVLTGTNQYTTMDRANIISGKLQSASLKDRKFWDAIQPGNKNSQVVLTTGNDIGGGYVMTADKHSEKKAGFSSDDAFAAYLLDQIKTALAPKLRDAKFDFQLTTPQEKLERANLYRLQADAVADQDAPHAIALYTQATRVSPGYATAYLALAKLYLKQGDQTHATDIITEGISNHADLSGTIANNYPDGAPDLVALLHKANS